MVIVELISAVGSLPITVNLALSPGMEFGLSDLPLSLSNGFSYVLMKKYHPAYFRARGMSEEKRVTAMSLDPAFTAFRSYVVWHVSVFFSPATYHSDYSPFTPNTDSTGILVFTIFTLHFNRSYLSHYRMMKRFS